jgi:hypothetical protein
VVSTYKTSNIINPGSLRVGEALTKSRNSRADVGGAILAGFRLAADAGAGGEELYQRRLRVRRVVTRAARESRSSTGSEADG